MVLRRLFQLIFYINLNFQIPNGFGCGLGAVQLILYAIYRNNKGENKKSSNEESVEMKKSNGKLHQQNASAQEQV